MTDTICNRPDSGAEALGATLDEVEQRVWGFWDCPHFPRYCPTCQADDEAYSAAEKAYFEAKLDELHATISEMTRQWFTERDIDNYGADLVKLQELRTRREELNRARVLCVNEGIGEPVRKRDLIDVEMAYALQEQRCDFLSHLNGYRKALRRKLEAKRRAGKKLTRRLRTVEIDGVLYKRTGKYQIETDGTQTEILETLE